VAEFLGPAGSRYLEFVTLLVIQPHRLHRGAGWIPGEDPARVMGGTDGQTRRARRDPPRSTGSTIRSSLQYLRLDRAPFRASGAELGESFRTPASRWLGPSPSKCPSRWNWGRLIPPGIALAIAIPPGSSRPRAPPPRLWDLWPTRFSALWPLRCRASGSAHADPLLSGAWHWLPPRSSRSGRGPLRQTGSG